LGKFHQVPPFHKITQTNNISQLEFSIILGSIAATLLNFGDSVSLASAWAFTFVACLALLYSMGIYLWRVDKIKRRVAVSYHDKWGPSFLCFALVVAVAVSFGYRIAKGSEGGLKGDMKGDLKG
jgi:hypothetical protein